MGIRCLHHHLTGQFQTCSMSIGFKMELLRGKRKVMWISININALSYTTGALQHNLFTLPSDPSHICQSIQIEFYFASEVGTIIIVARLKRKVWTLLNNNFWFDKIEINSMYVCYLEVSCFI